MWWEKKNKNLFYTTTYLDQIGLKKSQFLHNLKMVEVRSELWRLSRPTTLIKKGHLQPIAQDRVLLSISKEGDTTAWQLDTMLRQL